MKIFALTYFFYLAIAWSSQAHANSLYDTWKIYSSSVQVSTLKKADGTVIELDPKEEVLLTLILEAPQTDSGITRDVKRAALVTGSDGSKRIDVQIESLAESICGPKKKVNEFAMEAPDTASVLLSVKPGKYQLDINGETYGSLAISEKDIQVDAAADYPARAWSHFLDIFAKTFGPVDSYGIKSASCSVTSPTDTPKGLQISYTFSASTEVLSNGDTLIHKADSGIVVLDRIDTFPVCNGNYQWYWKGELSSATARGKLVLEYRNAEQIGVSFDDGAGKFCP
jgi:hypothetical protein